MTNTSATIVFTKAGQHVKYFDSSNSRGLDVDIQEYTDTHDLVIEQITAGSKGQYSRPVVLAIFTRRPTLACAQCDGPTDNDYLCDGCRQDN